MILKMRLSAMVALCVSVLWVQPSYAQCCAELTGETSIVPVAGHYFITVSAFQQNEQPNLTGQSIAGVYVAEESLTQGTNYCYYSNAPFPPVSTVTGGQWMIGGSDPQGYAINGPTQWGTDLDGDTMTFINDIRNNASLPCTDNIPQTMYSGDSCNPGPYPGNTYFYNTQTVTITSSTVTNCRAGQCDIINY